MADNLYDITNEILAHQKEERERLEKQHEELLNALRQAKESPAPQNEVRKSVDQRNQMFVLQNFIRRARHQHLWIGDCNDFANEQSRTIRAIWLAIGAMVLCTIVATASFGIYSTFTLFENIWLIFTLHGLKYTYRAKRQYSAIDYSLNSFETFQMDANGVLHPGEHKKSYKVFLILASISFVLNAIYAWLGDHSVPFLVTVLELGALALTIYAVYRAIDFFDGYGMVRFSGMNDLGTATVVLIYDPISNRIYIEEDFLKKHPYLK
ncbi:MAG: hypothetical protein IKC63_05340 [Clostridia bacterium]|nr:hypothetical protein [Clostridia bacterium]